MPARPDIPPPFDVMRRRPPLPTRAAHVAPTSAPPPSPPAAATPPARGIWARSRQAVVLRIPRGYLALLVVGVLLLLFTAFWAGRAAGFKNGFAQAQVQLEAVIPTGQVRDGEPRVAPPLLFPSLPRPLTKPIPASLA